MQDNVAPHLFNVKFPLLRLLQFLSDLKSAIILEFKLFVNPYMIILVAGAFPPAKDQDSIIHELHAHRHTILSLYKRDSTIEDH